MNAKALIICLFMAGPAGAQGFAGLGQDATGFAVPTRGQPLVFPRDHGAHPDYRIEWWYLTAVLRGEDGTDYGIQWTLFRSALAPGERPGWQSPQLWLAHAALTTPDRHFVAEKLARGGIGQAGVTALPFSAWIDDWQMTARTGAPGTDPMTARTGAPETGAMADAMAALDLTASGEGFGYRLGLQAQGPLVAQGDHGYSVKSAAGQASWYYSQPFYRAEGHLTVEGREIAVTGQAWLDREWSSQPLAADQTGWDWFSLMFDDGARLMGFRLRDAGAGFASATWIAADGTAVPMPPGALRVTPLRRASVAGRSLPVEWRVELPEKALDVTVAALNDAAWMDLTVPYWEGPIAIRGSHRGRGYLEMTGY